MVAPLAGAWIEIVPFKGLGEVLSVAPLAGAWIEIERMVYRQPPEGVAPLAGAWIEILSPLLFLSERLCRSPRGSVD